ncbi:EAL domain-containing protein [Thiomicrospira microaerophila]|uniref:EAL domain-containing protein n=1 Tax=Thiomicrospira microaerophila TaxID=406020 RepID=UPI0020109528|nr:EAL domain-containing protein [Thiomicrospira microaerophila]UQB41321.1 EAL domain-containing protein [Thiomicrospira microaerophila]
MRLQTVLYKNGVGRKLGAFLLLFLSIFPVYSEQEGLTLGILSFRPEDQMLQQWQPLVDHLQLHAQVPIRLQVFGFEALEQAVAENRLDLIITNSAHYVRIRARNPLTGPLATLIRQEKAFQLVYFGGVILMRADDPEPSSLADLSNLRMGAVSKGSFGGYQMQVKALYDAGLPIPSDRQLLTTGMPHDAVIEALLRGDVDVGFVRTGVFEDMLAEGRLKPGLLKPVLVQSYPDFPYVVSTPLYPEWPVVMMPHVSEELSRRIMIGLFSLEPNSEAAKMAGIHGFTRPADYQSVEQLLRALRISPFDAAPDFTLIDMWQRHGGWLLSFTALLTLFLIGIGLHIRAIRKNEASLKLAASVFSHAREGIVITDIEGKIIQVNDAFTRITGFSREEALGKNPKILSSGKQPKEFYQAMWQSLESKGHWYGELWNRRKTGEIYVQMTTISAVNDMAGKVTHYVALQSDITNLKEHEKRLEHIAHYDVLTNLPNRVLLADRLQQAMTMAERKNEHLAVLFLDLDGFKAVNDQFGHEVGDQLLVELARRMKSQLRKSDTLSRIGGDEFVILLNGLETVQCSHSLLHGLLHSVAQPIHIQDHQLVISGSIGVTFYPSDQSEAEQLIRHADLAMYQAKQQGKNRYHFFDIELDQKHKDHVASQQRIKQALAEREFVLYYQPKVWMQSGVVLGVEALIRWQHPERGLLPPVEFLPVIEGQALSAELDYWVLSDALRQLNEWCQQGYEFVVSVNIGARLLQQMDFVDKLIALAADYPSVPARLLQFEVLETSAIEDVGHVGSVIRRCQELGYSFALDDFGTGYSSLTYLRHLPAEMVKIDQSFVRDMLQDTEDLAIVNGVIGLSGAFHRQVLAEGVETIEHGEMLLLMGCQLAQGYGIARPMPAKDFIIWQKAWQPDPIWQNWADKRAKPVDLTLLFAEVEHRAWVDNLTHYLHGDMQRPPQLDAHLCHFGRWYDRQGQRDYGQQPEFQMIDKIHREVHHKAHELLMLDGHGEKQQAINRLHELYDLRDQMILALRSLLND